MSNGYTPVFGTIYTGSLYGRWPAAAVWASLLPLFDKSGCLDMSIPALCGMTGWPRELLEEGIRQLMEPDPSSRTPDCEGRRLVALDPGRPWGWRAVNHAKYRERARLMQQNAAQVEDGRNAEKTRRYRERLKRAAEAGDTARHPATPGDTLSDSDAISVTDPRARGERPDEPGGLERIQAVYPKFAGRQDWITVAHHLACRIEQGATWDDLIAGARRYAAFVRAAGTEGTQHVLHPRTFYSAADHPWSQPWELPAAPAAALPAPSARAAGGKLAKTAEQLAEDERLAAAARATADRFRTAPPRAPARAGT